MYFPERSQFSNVPDIVSFTNGNHDMEAKMRSKLTISAIIGVGGVLILNGSASAGAAADACSFLTTAQVSAALGIAVSDGQAIVPKLCVWGATDKQSSKKVSLTILTMDGFAIGKTPLQGTEKPAVSGVGDDAFYKYFAEPRYEKIKVVDLDVKKGSTAFGIEVGGLSADDAKAKAKTLALEALAKM
jgi:hypothetical protein